MGTVLFGSRFDHHALLDPFLVLPKVCHRGAGHLASLLRDRWKHWPWRSHSLICNGTSEFEMILYHLVMQRPCPIQNFKFYCRQGSRSQAPKMVWAPCVPSVPYTSDRAVSWQGFRFEFQQSQHNTLKTLKFQEREWIQGRRQPQFQCHGEKPPPTRSRIWQRY